MPALKILPKTFCTARYIGSDRNFAAKLFGQVGGCRQVIGVHVGLQYPSDLPAISRDLVDQLIGVGRFGAARRGVEIQDGIDNYHSIRGWVLHDMTGRIRRLVKERVNLRGRIAALSNTPQQLGWICLRALNQTRG